MWLMYSENNVGHLDKKSTILNAFEEDTVLSLQWRHFKNVVFVTTYNPLRHLCGFIDEVILCLHL